MLLYPSALLLCIAVIANTLTVPTPSHLTADTGNASNISSTDVSSVSAPPPPTGFEMRYNWDKRVKLSHLEMWLDSYAVLDRLARMDWHGRVRRDIQVFSGGVSLTLKRLQDFAVEIAVQALWQTARVFGNIEGPNFRRLFAGIMMGGRPVGILQYESTRRAAQDLTRGEANSTTYLTLNSTSNNQILAANVAGNISATPINDFWPDEGEVKSSEDERLTVYYGYNGRTAGRQVFVSMMDALATAAPHGLYSAFTELHSVIENTSGRIELTVFRSRQARPSWEFTYKQLYQALLLLWESVFMGARVPYTHAPRLEGLNFFIFYNGNEIGEGEVVFQPHGQSPSIATS